LIAGRGRTAKLNEGKKEIKEGKKRVKLKYPVVSQRSLCFRKWWALGSKQKGNGEEKEVGARLSTQFPMLNRPMIPRRGYLYKERESQGGTPLKEGTKRGEDASRPREAAETRKRHWIQKRRRYERIGKIVRAVADYRSGGGTPWQMVAPFFLDGKTNIKAEIPRGKEGRHSTFAGKKSEASSCVRGWGKRRRTRKEGSTLEGERTLNKTSGLQQRKNLLTFIQSSRGKREGAKHHKKKLEGEHERRNNKGQTANVVRRRRGVEVRSHLYRKKMKAHSAENQRGSEGKKNRTTIGGGIPPSQNRKTQGVDVPESKNQNLRTQKE